MSAPRVTVLALDLLLLPPQQAQVATHNGDGFDVAFQPHPDEAMMTEYTQNM